AHLGLARRDVHLRAGLDEAAGDHEPDAARAAGHEGHLAVDGEEVRHRRHHAAAARGREGPAAPPGAGLDHYHAGPSEDMKRAMDAALRRLARMLERRPGNAPGTDKAWVLRAMWQRLLVRREVRQARRADRPS